MLAWGDFAFNPSFPGHVGDPGGWVGSAASGVGVIRAAEEEWRVNLARAQLTALSLGSSLETTGNRVHFSLCPVLLGVLLC